MVFLGGGFESVSGCFWGGSDEMGSRFRGTQPDTAQSVIRAQTGGFQGKPGQKLVVYQGGVIGRFVFPPKENLLLAGWIDVQYA